MYFSKVFANNRSLKLPQLKKKKKRKNIYLYMGMIYNNL